MNRRGPASRGAFSLLEVMIATAILAGSAMVLLSLIDFGTRLGNRSEARITALVLAQSILDESIARLTDATQSSGQSQNNYVGSLPGTPARSYRLAFDSVATQEESKDWNRDPPAQFNQAPTAPGSELFRTEIVCVTVELFEGTEGSQSGSEPVVKLVRWVRVPANSVGGVR
jgi:prepilin-type N-terminal cleavage/methylation domain-containing protein